MHLSREILYKRHRLSHQQIDDFLNEQQHDLVFGEKMTQLHQVALFLKLAHALREADMWFVPYKGPMLSYRIYNDATCRRFKDFDFLIKPDKIRLAIDVFKKLGYVPRSFPWPDSRSKEKRLLLFLNQYSLHHPSKKVSVEIHWSLLKYPAVPFGKLAEIVDKNIQQTVFAGQEFKQFTLEFELLHLVIHGGLHTWSRLKWLVDIHEILKRFPVDKIKFEVLVRALNAQRMVGLCNAMLLHYYPESVLLPVDAPVPGWAVRYSLRQMNRITDTPVYLPGDLLTYRRFHLQAFPGWRYRVTKLILLIIFSLQNKKKNIIRWFQIQPLYQEP